MSTLITTPGSAFITPFQGKFPPTPKIEIDAAVAELQAQKQRWAQLTLHKRINLCNELLRGLASIAEEWVNTAVAAKGIDPQTSMAGEEWMSGPYVTARNLRLLRKSLLDLRDDGQPRLPKPFFTREDGQVVAPVFPGDGYDELLFRGFSGEIWLQPGISVATASETMAWAYRQREKQGKVALVLGAGNISSIAPMDCIYKLFVELQVVIVKMNPVNEYMGPILAHLFAPLIEQGFLRIAYGGAEEGAYLCQHAGVETIHMTGSDKTHDAIVFGSGPEGAQRKSERKPKIDKPITSELGNVSPVIVVPGSWSATDYEFQAENLVSMLTNNAGFNCNATRVIITHDTWLGRSQLLRSMAKIFASVPPRKAYYPGSHERFQQFIEQHPEAELFGQPTTEEQLPWALISELDANRKDDICFTTEAFCSVMSEVSLHAASIVDYIRKAVDFVNETVWGTLNAAIIVHPASLKHPEIAQAVEQAIADLRAGSVVINHWPAVSYGLCASSWGAFPGHDIYDIKSGIGVVHNTYMLEHIQKSVIRGPFRVWPKPPWFVTHRRLVELARKLVDLECEPAPWKLPGIFWTAVRG